MYILDILAPRVMGHIWMFQLVKVLASGVVSPNYG